VFNAERSSFSFFQILVGGLELFADLLQRFPNNTHLLLEMAKVRLAAVIYN